MLWDLTKWFNLSASKIAGSYLVFGVLWIGTTDWLVFRVARTQSQLVWMQSLKGWAFVALSGALVFGLVYVREAQLRTTHDRLQVAAEQLQVIHRVFRHNLRNELTVIRGYVGIVKSSIEQKELDRQLSTVQTAVDRLEQLNEDLQILEEVDEPKRELTDLSSVIENECNRLQSQRQSITIEKELPDDIDVYGGESLKHLVRRALEALSVRHSSTPADTHIEITVTQSDSEVTVVARSLDHQIPEIELSSLRAGEERPLDHALGVDLWVLKWLANRFNGDVDIRVNANHTTISVSLLPAAPLEQFVEDMSQQIPSTIEDIRQ